MENKTTGKIHIYTGDGKGKTTASVGLAVRALGHNLKVGFASFHKRPEIYGYNELEMLQKLKADVRIYAKGHPHMDQSIDEAVLKKEVYQDIQSLSESIKNENFDLFVLDEILISVRDGYLEENELLEFVNAKPKNMELVLTGRGATKKIMELADYVTEMKMIKHPYEKGLTSRKGIEY